MASPLTFEFLLAAGLLSDADAGCCDCWRGFDAPAAGLASGDGACGEFEGLSGLTAEASGLAGAASDAMLLCDVSDRLAMLLSMQQVAAYDGTKGINTRRNLAVMLMREFNVSTVNDVIDARKRKFLAKYSVSENSLCPVFARMGNLR